MPFWLFVLVAIHRPYISTMRNSDYKIFHHEHRLLNHKFSWNNMCLCSTNGVTMKYNTDRTAGRFFVVLRECIEIDLRRMVIAAAGGLQRRGSVGSIRTVLAVMTAYVRGTGLHRDALARKRHIRGSARRQQVDGKQQQRYESFQFHAIILGSGYSSTPHSASFPAHACASRRAVASSTS